MKSPLEQSIKHWENNLAIAKKAAGKPLFGTGFSISSEDCALCRVYFNDNCDDCPICKKVKRVSCVGTPYTALSIALQLLDTPVFTEKIIELVGKEVKFLKSLRPKKKGAKKEKEGKGK